MVFELSFAVSPVLCFWNSIPFSVFGGFFFLSFWGDLSCHFCSSTFFLFFLPSTETLDFFSKRLFLKLLADTHSIVHVFYWNLVTWMSSVSFEYLSFCSSLFLFLNSLLFFTGTFSMVLTYFFWSFVSYLFLRVLNLLFIYLQEMVALQLLTSTRTFFESNMKFFSAYVTAKLPK